MADLLTLREAEILSYVFLAEVAGATGFGVGVFQTKSKVAADLRDKGMLEHVELHDRSGYVLTPAGRLAYCESCKDG